jgi:LAO/AO transport system kinase
MLPNGWLPRVLTASALYGKGLEEVWSSAREFVELTKKNGYFDQHSQQQSIQILHDSILQNLKSGFFEHPGIKESVKLFETQILEKQISPYDAAMALLEKYFKSQKGG